MGEEEEEEEECQWTGKSDNATSVSTRSMYVYYWRTYKKLCAGGGGGGLSDAPVTVRRHRHCFLKKAPVMDIVS